MINDDELKAIAEYIILQHTEDIEYSSMWELAEYRLPYENLPVDEMEEVVNQIDKLISSAKVTVTFE